MRTPRLLASGTGYYHVILKTSGARFLFESDADKRALLGILERVSRFSGVQPLSYALLDNHVHLLLKVPERRSVPEAEFRRRVEALYGAARSGKLFAKWDETGDGLPVEVRPPERGCGGGAAMPGGALHGDAALRMPLPRGVEGLA